MGFVAQEDIRGYEVSDLRNSRILCPDCYKGIEDGEKVEALTEDDLQKNPGLYTCDECGSEIE